MMSMITDVPHSFTTATARFSIAFDNELLPEIHSKCLCVAKICNIYYHFFIIIFGKSVSLEMLSFLTVLEIILQSKIAILRNQVLWSSETLIQQHQQ